MTESETGTGNIKGKPQVFDSARIKKMLIKKFKTLLLMGLCQRIQETLSPWVMLFLHFVLQYCVGYPWIFWSSHKP